MMLFSAADLSFDFFMAHKNKEDKRDTNGCFISHFFLLARDSLKWFMRMQECWDFRWLGADFI
jgi:hypothetical protein